ncbi:uncharacterized protein CG7065 isoform X2 [Plutella xylostella]|uniref:uncharacterized protein CG7065 isoform X2 n=1 Tax=Plutella xylostella TaxID=51655 RepID=UPI0020326FEC|nr:uncharacterized protein CG7065 isoform X2 [Plutella xylostella]
MDLPDCPPGAEGYEDSVVQVPMKKPDDTSCTKAEQEFQEHLSSLKIKVEGGGARPMVERRGRDISGKWIYLCYPCAAMCSGEAVLQTHISGKKHKSKLQLRTVWPPSIFDEHPYILNQKDPAAGASKHDATERTLRQMATEVSLHNAEATELDRKYGRYRGVRTHIEDSLDKVKAPLIGLEYLIEHPPEQAHYEPSYMCCLCLKQGHPRTIVNHLNCFWHRFNYLSRHFPKAANMLAPYRSNNAARDGVNVVMNRVAQRIEAHFGRMKPVIVDKDLYDIEKEGIHQWIFKGHHNSEQDLSLTEIIDIDLINSLNKDNNSRSDVRTPNRRQRPCRRNRLVRDDIPTANKELAMLYKRKDSEKDDSLTTPSDSEPTKDIQPGDAASAATAAAEKPVFNKLFNVGARANPRNTRRAPSTESLSDISGDEAHPRDAARRRPPQARYENKAFSFRSRYTAVRPDKKDEGGKIKPVNMAHKLKMVEEKTAAATEAANKALAYHEKNPEKHPMYPDEWKKFWNRRYKEIQAEGKDPAKHDYKPEWIVFWTSRMKELHDEELRVNVNEIYRRLCITPPAPERDRPSGMEMLPRRRSPPPRDRRDRRPSPRHRASPRRRSPLRRHSPERRRSPERRPDRRRSPERRRSLERRRDPPRTLRTRSRSPLAASESRPHAPPRSPSRTNIRLESLRRSLSPLSRREALMRNKSPAARPPAPHTVTISDDELPPVDTGASPWNSADDLDDSLGSLPDAKSPDFRARSRTKDSSMSRYTGRSHRSYRPTEDIGPMDNVVATLRLLVALEDYLGSLGPKIVDLLTEALKMEKEKANSSEELLERESAVALMETCKEKLKGARQAGLVPPAAAPALRNAVVRVAALLHEADTRANKKDQKCTPSSSGAAVPVAGVGQVDRAQIAKQMAAALIAQGKTDVSSEELAQLVDAVVGMAEAKKREAEAQKRPEPRPERARPAGATGPASALQMLQSAYDEYDKKPEKDEAPDAMDGLSDSDLETLLKNFNELSAEEQHSLIAYLKKLEAKEPKRVERLREYVSTAATVAPPAVEEPAKKQDAPAVVDIESDDDDDYTVEEVFNTAKQKVKEDQIRQEMEIVTKSLLETKPEEAPATIAATTAAATIAGLDMISSSSAANLLAMVQATMAKVMPAAAAPAEVVSSGTQPRSFGDVTEEAMEVSDPAPAPMPIAQILEQFKQGGALGQPAPDNQDRFNNMQMGNANMGMNSPNMGGNMNQGMGGNMNSNMGNMNPNMGNMNPNMGNMNPNMGNMGQNHYMGNTNNSNMDNMGYNNQNQQMNDMDAPMYDRGMDDRNMSYGDRNMPMNRNMGYNDGNASMSDRNMPFNQQNNRNMPYNDRGNNMPYNDRNIPMRNNAPMNNMGSNDNMRGQSLLPPSDMRQPSQGGRPWNNTPNMQDNNSGGPLRTPTFFNQGGGRGGLNQQQDRNQNQQFGNNRGRGGNRGNQGGRGRGRGRGGGGRGGGRGGY